MTAQARHRAVRRRGTAQGTVIFVPPLPELDATAARLQGHGVKVLRAASTTLVIANVNQPSLISH